MVLSTNTESLLKKYTSWKTSIAVENKKMEVKKSTATGGGDGVFALEKIPKGTVFLSIGNANNHGTISKKMNDLAYRGDLEKYNTDENVLSNINVGYVVRCDDMFRILGSGSHEIYLYAINDVDEGQELSRFYGPDYWGHVEFWNRFPESKYLKTGKLEDLPSEYVYIDSIRVSINTNFNYSLFCKRNGDKYHYLIGFGKNYFEKNFFQDSEYCKFIDVSKKNFTKYKPEEAIKTNNGDMYTTSYLQNLR